MSPNGIIILSDDSHHPSDDQTATSSRDGIPNIHLEIASAEDNDSETVDDSEEIDDPEEIHDFDQSESTEAGRPPMMHCVGTQTAYDVDIHPERPEYVERESQTDDIPSQSRGVPDDDENTAPDDSRTNSGTDRDVHGDIIGGVSIINDTNTSTKRTTGAGDNEMNDTRNSDNEHGDGNYDEGDDDTDGHDFEIHGNEGYSGTIDDHDSDAEEGDVHDESAKQGNEGDDTVDEDTDDGADEDVGEANDGGHNNEGDDYADGHGAGSDGHGNGAAGEADDAGEYDDESGEDDDEGRDSWKHNGPGQVELTPGSEVFVSATELARVMLKYADKTTSTLIRRLIILTIPKNDLLTMTLTGRGPNRRKFPSEVLSAVESMNLFQYNNKFNSINPAL